MVIEGEFLEEFTKKEDDIKVNKNKYHASKQHALEEPIFTVDDVAKSNLPLTKLIRTIFIDQGITKEKFKKKHTEYAIRSDMTKEDMNNERNNHLKTLQQPVITYPFMEKMLTVVLGYPLENLSITFTHPETGELLTYDLKNIEKILMDYK